MLKFKRMACMLLTMGIFITAFPDQALASSDYQYITNISLKVEVDLDAGDEINSGDSVGTSKDDSGTKVYTTSDKYRVESAEWTNNKDCDLLEILQRSLSGWSRILLLILNMNIDSAAATAQVK